MSSVPKHSIPPKEYLHRDIKATYRSEYLHGKIYARAGASAHHHWIVCLAMVFVASLPNDALAEVPGKQLFTEHCEMCHSGAKAMGGFTVASLTEDFTDKQNLERWLTVLEQLKDGNMPPKEKPRPQINDVRIVMDWITTQAEKAESVRRETEGRVVMRRLNRCKAIQSLLDIRPSKSQPRINPPMSCSTSQNRNLFCLTWSPISVSSH